MNSQRRERESLAPSFPGPLLLLFPLLLLAAAIQVQRSRRPAPGEAPARPEAPGEELMPGWLGRAEFADGRQLRVRLSRLHVDDHWQRFDAGSLARRLDLGPGQPWRLELTLDGGRHAGGGEGGLELAGLELLDADGRAGGSLEAPRPDSPSSILDPLWGALAAPPLLASGETARLVLWGRAPAEGARLIGAFGEVVLHSESISARGSESALASLEERE